MSATFATIDLARFGVALSQREVAAVMTARGYPMCQRAVWETEQRALKKLARDPVLAILFDDLKRVFRDGSHYRFLRRPADAKEAEARS